jgi:hypothetical protein
MQFTAPPESVLSKETGNHAPISEAEKYTAYTLMHAR